MRRVLPIPGLLSLLSLLSLISLLSMTGQGTADEAKSTAAGTRMAVVNLVIIFNNYKPFQLGEENLKKEAQQFNEKLATMDEELKQLDNSLHAIKESDPRHGKLEEDFETLKVKQKLADTQFRSAYTAKAIDLTDKTYQKLNKLLEEYAHENGIMMVQQMQTAALHGRTIDDVLNQMDQHVVLYADPSLDITKPFLAFVNDRYTSEAAQSPPVITPPPGSGTPGTEAPVKAPTTQTPTTPNAPTGKAGQATGAP